ncbi:hypothetical protein Mapa_009913 [Marchantia paleacea]|nr:hypothetical protein Mapa_009913 [Marchantia paleacea]
MARSGQSCSTRAIEQQKLRIEVWTVLAAGILLWTCVVEPVVSQEPVDFVSIDCGGNGGKDPITQIDWVSDSGFLDSESQLVEEGVAIRANVSLDSARAASRDNAEQLKTAMVFVPGAMSKSKYCYNLTVSHNDRNSTDYLVRAMFPSSNLTAVGVDAVDVPLNVYGTRFYFTVDSTFVSTIDLDPRESTTVELVVSSLDESLYICLVPLEDRSSMPAISSLELRPLNGTLYSKRSSAQSNTGSTTKLQSSYLMTIARLNFGGDESSPAVRYPLDPYDRLWYAARIPAELKAEVAARRKLSKEQELVAMDADNDTPANVLNTAWEGVNMSSEISFSFDIKGALALRPVPTFFYTMMFLDVGPPPVDETETRLVDVLLEHTGPESYSRTQWISAAQVVHSLPHRWYNYKQLFYDESATFRVSANRNGTLPPMVNAAELYGEFDAVTQRTAHVDGK